MWRASLPTHKILGRYNKTLIKGSLSGKQNFQRTVK